MAQTGLFDSSIQLLRGSLTGLAKREQLISTNLANVDTPGYRAYDVPFERVLEQRMSQTGELPLVLTSSAHIGSSPASLQEALAAQQQPVYTADGNGVDIDSQMSRLSEAVIQYNAVSQLLQSRLALLRSAISEGRR